MKPRIRLIHGQWYAFGNNTKGSRLLLVPAINFCKRLNKAQLAAKAKGGV